MLHLAHVKLEVSHSKRYVSQVMQALQPALEALTERGYCTWELVDSQTDSGKKLVFDRIQVRALPPDSEEEPLAALSPAQRTRYDALTERGVSTDSARDLVLEQPLTTIDRQLHHFDHLVAEGTPPKSSGWLIAAVTQDYGLPPTLLAKAKQAQTKAQAERKEAAVAADRKRRQAESQAQTAAERSARQQSLAELLAPLSDDERSALETQAVARLDAVNRARYEEQGYEALGLRDLVETEILALLREHTG